MKISKIINDRARSNRNNKYLIIGYGKFGKGFAHKLLAENIRESNIYIVDKNQERLDYAKQIFTNIFKTNISDFDTINSFDINDIDVVVIGMSDIEESLMIAANCKKYNDKRYYAKSKNDVHSKLLKTLGVDETVIPEEEIGSKLAYKSLFKNNVDITDISTNYNIVHFKVTNPKVVGKTVIDLNIRKMFDCNIFGIRRDESFYIPDANHTIKMNDTLSIVCKKEDSSSLLEMFTN